MSGSLPTTGIRGKAAKLKQPTDQLTERNYTQRQYVYIVTGCINKQMRYIADSRLTVYKGAKNCIFFFFFISFILAFFLA